MSDLTDLIRRANQISSVFDVLGDHKVYRSGRRYRGACPVCGDGQSRTSTRFWVDDAGRRWGCFNGGASQCSKGGDAVDLYAAMHRLSVKEAAEKMTGTPLPKRERPPQAERRRPERSPADEDAAKLRQAAEFWKKGKPAAGTVVETYLRARGIDGPILDAALRQLRFVKNAYHSGPTRKPVRFPAMVGLVRTPAGPTGGVHVTYLAPDGSGKAPIEPAKRMWGPQAALIDGVWRPGCVWLSHPCAPGGLVEAEGIETALSAAILAGGPRRVVAALSLRAVQGGLLLDKWGRMDPEVTRPDPGAPAFTWPEPKEQPWGEIMIAIDRDMKPVKVKVRKATGGTLERHLSSEERARICASLAVAAWKATTPATVRAKGARAGMDFNDELRARLGAGEGLA
ncbi:hypothetical protein CA606_18140 [Caulobacter vibrioides]|uniref:DUF7146 domain-containing protein n=1 Tax=Caulobacter vibrioides TaxID=155892 RepID=A0A290MQP8_CAUVI|nr:hypothetical protein [Caulobacter vibrioides]ATC34095.1 hypothetical protein CA606_18140 [Caulobacter vibrioides]